jgi:hypothetical protein
MLWITSKEMATPGGRALKFGDTHRRAPLNQMSSLELVEVTGCPALWNKALGPQQRPSVQRVY